MNERMKELRKALGMTLEAFGKSIGLSKSSIGHIENGKIKLTDRNLNIICTQHNVNKKWLKCGQGEMFKDNSSETQLNELVELFNANNAMDIEFLKLILNLKNKSELKIIEDLINRFNELNNSSDDQ